jgi:replication initiation protein RepC
MTFQRAIPRAFGLAMSPAAPAARADETWGIFRVLRDAAPRLGIKPKVVQTLSALLSCLKPGRGMICFASNAELQRRLAGVSDKTIRRHLAELAEAGVIQRRSSPNGKRYSTRDPLSGTVEAYGIDLSPMIENRERWSNALAEAERNKAQIRHLRTKILARLAWIDDRGHDGIDTTVARTVLRRTSLTPALLEEILAELDNSMREVDELHPPYPSNSPEIRESHADPMTATGGQNDRHLLKSYHEDHESDSREEAQKTHQDGEQDMLVKLQIGCPSAMEFALEPVTTWDAADRHAGMLAPMIGIDHALLAQARERLGLRDAAITVLAMVQLQPRIRNMQAYFRSLVAGTRSVRFNPVTLLDRLVAGSSALS